MYDEISVYIFIYYFFFTVHHKDIIVLTKYTTAKYIGFNDQLINGMLRPQNAV